MGTGTLSESSCGLVNALLKENKIYEKVTEGIDRTYTHADINPKNGSIVFGKYSWHGFSGFWNRLIKCSDKISFNDFALRTWDALVDMTVGTAAHEPVLKGLSREIIEVAIRNKNYDEIIDRFMDIDRHLAKDSYWRSKSSKVGERYEAESENPSHCIVTVGERRPTVAMKVVDAVGEVFEVLNVRWTGSHRSGV